MRSCRHSHRPFPFEYSTALITPGLTAVVLRINFLTIYTAWRQNTKTQKIHPRQPDDPTLQVNKLHACLFPVSQSVNYINPRSHRGAHFFVHSRAVFKNAALSFFNCWREVTCSARIILPLSWRTHRSYFWFEWIVCARVVYLLLNDGKYYR
jgi:hypothetical protein